MVKNFGSHKITLLYPDHHDLENSTRGPLKYTTGSPILSCCINVFGKIHQNTKDSCISNRHPAKALTSLLLHDFRIEGNKKTTIFNVSQF